MMKLPGLINLCLILILASLSKGQKWSIDVPRQINATEGSNVTIPCTFTHPYKSNRQNVQVYWKTLSERFQSQTTDLDKYAFIFHTNETFVIEKYRGKTMLIGDKDKGNCSLKIKDIKFNDPSVYVRIVTNDEKYSFKKILTSINVDGGVPVNSLPITDITFNTLEVTTIEMTKMTSTPSTQMYTTIFVPVAALLIIIFVGGIIFCIKHKRSKSFTREDSGYYANFRRTSSNQAKREGSYKKEDKKLPEPQAIDEPVYINMEGGQIPTNQMWDNNFVWDNVGHVICAERPLQIRWIKVWITQKVYMQMWII
ncbi:uncharacterized protein LOC127366566 isoform X2 [Dicentrarchus labrax]|uniref:uncharacterized protein LOC127366566 isoform X2 n=1 Tax=Dicentrarchus labrax TaxID=13489 RepID=UPI0021F55795|nr:uncharacterized protein LOC127366566 isoform X2 [Dicentrarchus labrax]